ncbi:hypothetical protein ACAG26_02975 [Mycobacterium sp. pUA109]|uniref:hypothetical protein n=1 Tax=Mycobacterium sp. pUA109 TaxID=3238982 RepID=UPI00351B8EBF
MQPVTVGADFDVQFAGPVADHREIAGRPPPVGRLGVSMATDLLAGLVIRARRTSSPQNANVIGRRMVRCADWQTSLPGTACNAMVTGPDRGLADTGCRALLFG